MTSYVLIESRFRRTGKEAGSPLQLAGSLASKGEHVTLFLVQNGVLAARRGVRSPAIEEARKAGVVLLADEFSLRERGIDVAQIGEGIESSPLEYVVDRLAAGDKIVWH